jgi:putative transposase
MGYDPTKHQRRSIRMRGYDYTQTGWYFVTICAQGRECLFGNIIDGAFQANTYGRVVLEHIEAIASHFANAEIDVYVMMPNHAHVIIILNDSVTANTPRPTLGQVVAYIKYLSTRHINELRRTPGARVWQRNYYEHIIRDQASLDHIRAYIISNPSRWESDQLYPNTPSRW